MGLWKWLSEGRCENAGDKDVTVCIDGKPHTLKPGEATSAGKDCDGIIHDDGSATKVHGRSGIHEHKSKEWVKEHWPECRVR